MFNIIEAYIKKLNKNDIRNFSSSKGANLSDEEIDFTYNFIIKNWQEIIKNPSIFDIDRYKNHYKEENFIKIKQVFNEYLHKFNSIK